MTEKEDIAIIGVGLRFPGGSKTPDEFWNQLINKFDGITETPKERWSKSFYDQGFISNRYGGFVEEEEWKRFDPLFFGISPKEATYLDPQQRMLTTILWEALEDAHIQPNKLRGSNTGVFIGLMNLDYQKQHFRDILDMSPYLVTGNGNSFISNRLSFCFDFRGPSMTLDTACSSSLNAIYLGMQAIHSGDCEMAVVGGVNALYDPTITISFSSLNMLSHKGRCRSFDEGADGFVRSEGAGLVILKKLSKAVEDGDRIYCVLKGGSSNVDGYNNKTTITAPSRHAQSENIEIALANSRLSAGDIYYIESHGTGTPVGDPVEVEALSSVFTSSHSTADPLVIGSVKSNIGHLESAAGVASLIKCCLMLKHRQLVPNIHFNKVNPKIKLDEWNIRVVTANESFPTDRKVRMGVNSFGLSGSNCHLIVEEFDQQTTLSSNTSIPQKEYIIPFSANSKVSLDKYLDLVVKNVDNVKSQIALEDFVRFQTFSKANISAARKIVVAKDWSEVQSLAKTYSTSKPLTSNIAALGVEPKIPIVFVFCGQGPQWKGMGQVLYQSLDVFKQAVDHCDQLLASHFGYSILHQLNSLPNDNSPEIHHPKLAQPSVFLIQVGLVALYNQWNIKPTIVVGHSFGEVTAAYCANIISLETAAKIVYHRSTLQNLTIGSGKMLSIGMGADVYVRDYQDKYPTLEIACYNSSDSIVITGAESDLKEAASKMKDAGVFVAFLTTPCSFHSSHQEKIKQQVFESPLKDIEYSGGKLLPFFSTIHGGLLQTKEEYNVQYIYDNLREPVAFTKAIDNIFKYIGDNQLGASPVFLEIAPHSTLAFYIKKLIPAPATEESVTFTPLILSPLNRKKNELESFHTALGELYSHGLNLDFAQQFTTKSNSWKESTTSLPRYQWDTELYWEEPIVSQKIRLEGPQSTLLGSKQNVGGLIYDSIIDVNMPSFQFLKGHKVKGKYLFPGAGYMDNIISALGNGQDVAIHNLEFNTPFFLTEGVMHHLQTSIATNSRNEFKVEFNFRDGNKTEKWTKSAHGRVSTYTPSTTIHKLNIEDLKKQCQLATLTKDEVYGKLQTLGLPYGPTFQRIASFSFGVNCSLSKMELNPRASQFDTSFFNASILDCCLHGLLALMDGPQELVFERLENFKLYSSAIPTTHPEYVYLFSKSIKQAGNTSQGTVDILLEDGTVLASFGKIVSNSLIKVKRTTTIKHPSKDLYTPIWQTKQSPLVTPILAVNNNKSPLSLEEDERLKQYVSLLIKEFVFDGQDKPSAETTLTITPSNQRLFDTLVQLADVCTNGLSLESLKQDLSTKYASHAKDLKLLARAIKTTIPSLLKSIDGALVTNQLTSQDEEGYTQLESILYQSVASKEVETVLIQYIKSALTPLITGVSPRVVKLLDVGLVGTIDSKRLFTINIINTIAQIIGSSQSTIDYTIVCGNDTKELLQAKFVNLPSQISIKYRTTVVLEKELLEQNLLVSNYDLILSSYSLFASSQATNLLQQFNKVLAPKGQLVAVEPPRGSLVFDLVAGSYTDVYFASHSQDSDRSLHPSSTLNGGEWTKLLTASGYETSTFYQTLAHHPSIVVGQKAGIDRSQSTLYDRIIFVVSSESSEIENGIVSQGQLNAKQVETFLSSSLLDSNQQQQQRFIDYVTDGTNNVIVFTGGLEELTVANYRTRTYEFVKVNQLLLKHQSSTKLILLTSQAQKEATNYLASSLVGIYRYFLEQQHVLSTTAIDLDNATVSTVQLSYLLRLTDVEALGEKEFVVRKSVSASNSHQALVQRYQRAPKALVNQSTLESNKDSLCLKLNSNLSFVLHPRDTLAAGQVEIEVKATGINYKDNLFYRGLLPQEIFSKGDIYNPPFGLECAGIVTRVAPDVTRFVVGDQVVGFASHSFASHTVTHQDRIVKKPSNISFVQAASIPIVYATAYYSIFHVGHFTPSKESILVHSSTGGVGIAALNLLKYKKHTAPVFATIGGSQAKADFLRKQYGSLITAILSTANNTVGGGYPDQIRQHAETSEGVDLVLNTLSGDFLKPNFDALSPIGRIMDLSVTQLMENDNIDIEVFKYHVGYQTIDLERAIAYSPKIVNAILQEIFDAIESGQLDAIPIESFPVRETKKAIEYINERKHIGKIVVDFADFERDVGASVRAQSGSIVKPSYTIDGLSDTLLVTGQTGIAVFILRWLLEHAPAALKNVIVVSRSALKWELQHLINQQRQRGNTIEIHYRSCDVSNRESLQAAIESVYAAHPSTAPVKSVIHFATIYDYCEVDNISQRTIDATHDPKAVGAVNLHQLSVDLKWNLNHFVLFSSIVSVLGSTNQASYTSANFVLDSLAQYRRSRNLAATAINWGALDAGGEVAKDKSVSQFLKSRGINLVSLAKILSGLGGVFGTKQCPVSQVMLSNFSYRLLFEHCPQIRSKLEHLAPDADLELKRTSSADASAKGGNSIADRVVAEISELLSIHPSKLNMDTRLKDYGIDSLLTVQLKNWIDQEFQKNLFTHLQLSSNSINSIIQKISAKSPSTAAAASSATKTSVKSMEVTNSTSKSVGKPLEFWKKEAELDAHLTPSKTLKPAIQYTKDSKISVLLTGATGYLGIYLLYNYLQSNQITKVYCVVRSRPTVQEAANFLRNKLQSLQLVVDDAVFDAKVVPVLGDLSQPALGVGEQLFTQLADQVDLIVSNGANVNFLEEYDEVKLTNVTCAKELIRLSITGERQKRLVHISSISVFFNDKRDTAITEQSFPTLDYINDMNGYIQSKVITEYLVRAAAQRGIPASIMRVGPIFADSRTGIDNDNDILGLVVKAIYELGAYPSFDVAKGEGLMNTSPIDWMSLATSRLSLEDKFWNTTSNTTSTFHLINTSSTMNNVLDICQVINEQYPLREEKQYLQWKQLLMSSNGLACGKIKLFFKDSQSFPLFHIGFGDCSQTTSQLALVNVDACQITKHTIIKNIEYYQSILNSKKK